MNKTVPQVIVKIERRAIATSKTSVLLSWHQISRNLKSHVNDFVTLMKYALSDCLDRFSLVIIGNL